LLPGGGGWARRRPVSGTVNGIIPNSAGRSWPGSAGAGQAVSIYRQLAADHPDAFLHEFAGALNNRADTRKTTYRVRWVVAGNRFGESFAIKQLAEAYRASLITAAGNGEGFDTETGLPVSIVETLARVIPVVVRDLAGAPDPDVLGRALRKKLNQGEHASELAEEEAKAIGWITKASRPVSALEDPFVVCDVLDVLAVRLDGKPAAPVYFSRRRRVLHRTLGYAVRKKRLDKNPLSKGNLPEDWTPRKHRTTPSTPAPSEARYWPATCCKRAARSGSGRDRGSSRSTPACSTR
jgi:hypothetical protein